MSLAISGVTLRLAGADRDLIANLSLRVAPGAIVSIVGASGAGKSTLLDFIGGHLGTGFAATGSVSLNGVDITAMPAHRRGIGVLFQDAMLFPHLSVGDNVAFGLTGATRGRVARRLAVGAALASVGLAGFERRDPKTLSGGQAARVALVRTLLARPKAVLLDEPFSRLDPGLRSEIRALVFDRIRQEAIPALLVTHDAQDAAQAAGPVVPLG